jgi:hypothetical protein
VHDHVGGVGLDDRAHPLGIGDVGPLEPVARVVGHRLQGIQVPSIGELVDHEHLMGRVADEDAHDGRADEPGAAGHEKSLHEPPRNDLCRFSTEEL